MKVLTRASRFRRSRRQASAQRLVCSRASVSPTYSSGVATPGAVAISLLQYRIRGSIAVYRKSTSRLASPIASA